MIRFHAKTHRIRAANGETVLAYVRVPELTPAHCDTRALRAHHKSGACVASSLFPQVLERIRREVFGADGRLRLDSVPAGVTVKACGSITTVILEVLP